MDVGFSIGCCIVGWVSDEDEWSVPSVLSDGDRGVIVVGAGVG